MLILCLLWLVTTVRGQHLASPDGACEEGWECRQERHCDPFLDQKDRLERLDKAYQQTGDEDIRAEHQKLLDKLKELVCNKEEKGVCCKKQLEIVNGNIVDRVEDMPYIVKGGVIQDFFRVDKILQVEITVTIDKNHGYKKIFRKFLLFNPPPGV